MAEAEAASCVRINEVSELAERTAPSEDARASCEPDQLEKPQHSHLLAPNTREQRRDVMRRRVRVTWCRATPSGTGRDPLMVGRG